MKKVKSFLEKWLPTLAIIYLIFGFIFAFAFALYYRWSPFSFFSPGFFSVVFTWPFQIGGFINDFSRFGFEGKPLGY